MSNNLNLTQVSSTQLQKEVTINAQAAAIDAAFTELYEIVGDTSPSLSAAEYRSAMVFRTDGAQTAAVTLTVPAIKRFFLADNILSSYDLDVVVGSTTETVIAGDTQIFYTDGTTDGLVPFINPSDASTGGLPVISAFVGGQPQSSELLAVLFFVGDVTLPINLTGSYAYADTAPTGAYSIDIKKNGGSIGSIDFAASTNAATFTFSSGVNFTSGDKITLEAPVSTDATIADISISLLGA